MSIDSISLRKGEVAFLWFNNYSGVVIRTPSKTLVVDPADVDPLMFKKVDAVLITHEHGDHFDEVMVREIFRRTQCTVLADTTSAKRLRDVVPASKLHEMKFGNEVKIDNLAVRAEAFRHPATAPASYMITSDDGVRVYHTGDSLPFPDMKRIGEQSPPDIVFCTVGTPAPGATPETGLEIVKMVKPKMAVPYHAPDAERKKFVELVTKEAPNVKTLLIERGKPYKYP